MNVKLDPNDVNGTYIKFTLFKLWLEFSLEYKTTLLSKHSIVHYAILYSKNLIANVRKMFSLLTKDLNLSFNLISKANTFRCNQYYFDN